MSRTLLSLAGFQVIIRGRFWVIAEGIPAFINLFPRDKSSLPTLAACRGHVCEKSEAFWDGSGTINSSGFKSGAIYHPLAKLV